MQGCLHCVALTVAKSCAIIVCGLLYPGIFIVDVLQGACFHPLHLSERLQSVQCVRPDHSTVCLFLCSNFLLLTCQTGNQCSSKSHTPHMYSLFRSAATRMRWVIITQYLCQKTLDTHSNLSVYQEGERSIYLTYIHTCREKLGRTGRKCDLFSSYICI